MSSFTTPLIVEVLDDGVNYEVHEAFEYRIGDENSTRAVQVPVGYITDFASIPRIFWTLLSPTGKYGKAAVVHDYLCNYRKVMQDGEATYISRDEVDHIFLEAMEVLKVNLIVRRTLFGFVRAYAIVTGIDRDDAKAEKAGIPYTGSPLIVVDNVKPVVVVSNAPVSVITDSPVSVSQGKAKFEPAPLMEVEELHDTDIPKAQDKPVV